MSEEILDHIIVSIKLRLGELDLEISDAFKALKDARRNGGQNCYGAGYEAGVLETLQSEEQTLRKIMGGYYGGRDE